MQDAYGLAFAAHETAPTAPGDQLPKFPVPAMSASR